MRELNSTFSFPCVKGFSRELSTDESCVSAIKMSDNNGVRYNIYELRQNYITTVFTFSPHSLKNNQGLLTHHTAATCSRSTMASYLS